MPRTPAALLLATVVLAGAASAKDAAPRKTAADARTPLQSMVAAERAFAKRAADTSVREAFLAWLAPGAIMLDPLPTNGPAIYTARPVTTSKLVWEPEYAEVAASGDYGMSTGPWEFTPPGDSTGAKRVYGTFLSIWEREGRAAPWRVTFDTGVPHAKPSAPIAFVAGPEHATADAAGAPVNLAALKSLDVALTIGGLGTRVTDDMRYLAHERAPVHGDAARAVFDASPAGATWRPLGGSIALSGDLGLTYGVRITPAPAGGTPDTVVYAHVWRRVDARTWKIAAALDNPLKR